MAWARHVTGMTRLRACVWLYSLKKRDHSEEHRTDEGNANMDLKEIVSGGINLNNFGKHRLQGWAFVNTVMNPVQVMQYTRWGILGLTRGHRHHHRQHCQEK
jgi:hypothetical protein